MEADKLSNVCVQSAFFLGGSKRFGKNMTLFHNILLDPYKPEHNEFECNSNLNIKYPPIWWILDIQIWSYIQIQRKNDFLQRLNIEYSSG